MPLDEDGVVRGVLETINEPLFGVEVLQPGVLGGGIEEEVGVIEDDDVNVLDLF